MSTTRFLEVTPVLPVQDVRQAIAYYTERLDFRLRFQDSVDAPKYAGVARDGVRLDLQWHAAGDFAGVEAGTLSLRFLVDDVQALFAEYQGRGVFHDRTALQDMPWGTREFAFYDPDGNGLFFCQNLS